jgi:hypothetical protein
MLQLTTSVYGDREKVAYGEEIVPDVVTDAPLEAALEWLSTGE